MSKIKKLAGETVLYGLGSIVPRFINFLLVWLHTEVFHPEEYSVITKLFAYTAVLNTLYLFGMETAYFRFATKGQSEEQRIFNLSQTVIFAIGVALTATFILLNDQFATLINLEGGGEYVTWLAIIMLTDALVAIPFARLRLQKKAIRFAAGKVINILLLVGLNVYFLVLSGDKNPPIVLVLIANCLANLFFIIFFFKDLISWRPLYDRIISPQMFKYAYPIMITGLAGVTNEMFSRITLDAWLPPDFYGDQSSEHALGVFGACYKLSVLMSLAITAFRYAAEPFFFSNASDKNSPDLFARVNHYFVIVCCVLLLGVGINLDILKYFLGDESYWEGLEVVPILLVGYLFLGVYYNFSVWFKLTDRTYWGTIISIGGAVLTIVANYFLIPILGYVGSSLATLICYFSMTTVCYLLGQKFFPIPYRVGISMIYVSATTGIVYLVNGITIANTWLALSFHAAVLVIFLLAIYAAERKQLRTITK